MKKRILIGIYIMMLLVCVELVFNCVYNGIIVYCYKNANYTMIVEPLMVFNWNEPYIAYYNKGNICYQKENYLDAIEAYNMALKKNPPEEKECAIRINIALTMLATIKDSYQNPTYVDECLTVLYEAREVLLENGCATAEGEGHSKKAEQLREEIEAMINELEQKQSESEDQKESDSTEETEASTEEVTEEETTEEETTEEKQQEEDSSEEDIEKKMKERQSKANKERQENLQQHNEFDFEFDFDSDGLIW
ncbi:MAG: tetratricopeptide repeat protein [Lachnospiraceae bacterium]|nr:tetratricopeptide repeat protein [Lachnospiraceae bacterium]